MRIAPFALADYNQGMPTLDRAAYDRLMAAIFAATTREQMLALVPALASVEGSARFDFGETWCEHWVALGLGPVPAWPR